MKLAVIIIGITSMALSGCSGLSARDYNQLPGPSPIYEPKSKMGNMSSYVVWGERYHVMDDAKGFSQEGVASWYGKKFHGNKTSNGEIYDMYDMTAAHKNLPLPSYVHVHNIDNGKEAIVRVNDRGPFHDNRIIDLSYSAAKSLGFDKKGLANVKISVITVNEGGDYKAQDNGKKTQERKMGLDRRWLNVQILITRNRADAEGIKKQLDAKLTHPVFIDSRPLTRDIHVRVGPVRGIDNARLLTKKMKDFGYSDALVVD